METIDRGASAGRSLARCACRTALLAIALAVAAPLAHAAAPTLTDAEKAACEIVAEHLAKGPQAFVNRLDKSSPLGALPPSDALAELRARLGPNEGASWELRTTSDDFAKHGAVFHVVFPSGAEDVIALDLAQSGSAFNVRDVRTLVDVPPGELKQIGSAAPAPAAPAAPAKQRNLLWFLIGAPLLAIVGAVTRRAHPHMSSAALIAALAVFAVPVAETIDPNWTTHLREAAPRAKSRQTTSFLSLAPLVEVRRAIATGDSRPPSSALEGIQREAATLWQTEADIGRISSDDAGKKLASVKALANTPLATLLRARIASDAGRRADATREYAALNDRFVAHDGFDLERQFATQDDAASQKSAARAEPRSRDAGLYYVYAAEQIFTGDEDAARKAFREAWRLQPISRRSVIEASVFAFLLRDPTFSILLNFNTPEEQKLADVSLSRSPMTVPAATKAYVSGEFVRLSIGSGRLDIPGGCAIAPRGATVLSPTELERADAEAAVRGVSQFASRSLSSAAVQRVVEEAADALSKHNRWDDILKITDGITANSENIPASLLTWRIRALLRAHRNEEARQIATGAAMAAAMQRAPDAGTLIEVSALLERAEAWSDAADLLQRVSTIKNGPDVGILLRRLQLRRQLATSPPVVTTQHFAIHATADVPVTVPERIGELLEAELQRVSARLGTTSFSPVRVNVLRWDDFREQLTFSDHILGFYDGEITIPFGDVSRFRDSVVAILTHEMTHAVVAQATRDNAPHWFQEGVAQRMELVERQENIFRLQRDQQFLALELVDPTMTNSVDPLAVGQAYVVAQSCIRFLEDRYGAATVPNLMAEFGRGSDTDEALTAVTGKSMREIDREFREWGLSHGETFVDSTPWPYAAYYSLGIDPAIRQGIRFSRPKP